MDVPTAPCGTVFSCLSKERALNVKVKHGAQLHAQHTRDVHGGPRSVFFHSNSLCKCFSGVHLMGRGVDWSLAEVQFVRDGMAGGANLSLHARSRSWSCSLEKLVMRVKHGESGTRKQRIPSASRRRGRGQHGGRHPDKPTSVLGRFGRKVRVLTPHDSTQVV